MLKVNDLFVSFGGLTALDMNSFELEDKELRVIIGPNGAGKSTFIDILSGKTKPQRGSVIFNETQLIGKKEVEIARLGVGRKFQKPSVFSGLTVFDNLLLGLKMRKDIFSSLFFTLKTHQRDKIEQVAKQVGLFDLLQTLAGSLSHGQKQWLEIAILMLQAPQLMLIDEPAAGMSDAEAEKTAELICDLKADHSLIVIEHDMNFVRKIAIEKVSVLVRGQILTEGNFETIRNNQEVIDCYLGSPDSAQVRNAA